MRLPVRLKPQTSGQQHHVRVGAEHRAGRAGASDSSADRAIKTLQAILLSEVIADGTVHAAERIEITRGPSVVFHHQLLNKGRALLRLFADEVCPYTFGFGAARHHRAPIGRELEHAAEEIKHVGERLDALHGSLFAEGVRHVAIQLRHSEIHAAQRVVAEEHVDEFTVRLLLRREPVICAVEHRRLRWLVVV